MAMWRDDWTGFFLVYFKMCYYLCVSPFRFEWDERIQKFQIRRNRLQSFVCATLYILLGLWYLKDLRKIPVDHLYKNPVVYFTLAFNLNAIYYHVGVLATSFWRRQDTFLAIVNFNCDGYAISTVKNKLVAVFLCFLFAILPLIYSIFGYSVISSSQTWDPTLIFRCLVVEGRFAFFHTGAATKLATNSCSRYVPPNFDEITIFDTFLGVLAFMMETARQIVGFYSDFFPLICCLSLWTCTETLREVLCTGNIYNERSQQFYLDCPIPFDEEQCSPQNEHKSCHQCYYCPRLSLVDDITTPVEESAKNSKNEVRGKSCGIILAYIAKQAVSAAGATSAPIVPEKVAMQKKDFRIMESGGSGGRGVFLGRTLLERYEVCKSFSRTVNRALGQILFAYVLSSIMYLSTCMDAVLVLQDWFGKFRVAFFFSIFILMFFIGSEIVNKVYGVRAWLSDPVNSTFLPEKNLLVLIHEVTCKSIGVSGNGMFTITYSTFMTVMTTTVTFFIIILQFQKPRGDREDLSGTLSTLNNSLHGLNNLITLLSSQPIMQLETNLSSMSSTG